MLHEGHAWNSIPIFNMFHVNPGLFRGSACVPDCKPSAIWQQYAWLQHYSNRDFIEVLLHVESTTVGSTHGSILCLACSALAKSALLQATGASTWQSCRTPRHHTDKHPKNMLCCATSRNLQEMTTGQDHFTFTNQKKKIIKGDLRSVNHSNNMQARSEMRSLFVKGPRSQQHGPSCPPNGFPSSACQLYSRESCKNHVVCLLLVLTIHFSPFSWTCHSSW